MTVINSATSTGMRRLLLAALIAVATTLGGSALGSSPSACAEPKTTGSQASYDECVSRGSNKRLCCSLANGDWTETKYYDANGNYLYSTWDCKGLAMQHRAPLTVRNPGVITGTFAPAP
jgi:hypothetical protein